MKPAAFDYQAPDTVEEAVALLGRSGPTAVPLAGGQSLVPMLNMRRVRPGTVVDLNHVPGLAEIHISDESVRIGAMTRLRTLENHGGLREALPVLPEAAALVAHLQIRHRSTLGGSLCHADPAAQLPAVAVAVDARLHLRSVDGVRTVPAQDFFQGALTTARRPDELLTAVELPRPSGFRFHFEEVTRRGNGGFPFVGLCLGVVLDGPAVSAARLAAAGVADRPLRLRAAEQALLGRTLTGDDLGGVLDAAVAEAEPPSDVHGSAAFRNDLLRTVIRRAVARLAAERRAR